MATHKVYKVVLIPGKLGFGGPVLCSLGAVVFPLSRTSLMSFALPSAFSTYQTPSVTKRNFSQADNQM